MSVLLSTSSPVDLAAGSSHAPDREDRVPAPHLRARLCRLQLKTEHHLDQRLDLQAAARRAGISPYHFHRLFHRLTGEPFAAHLRRLRLERAAFTLVNTDEAVTQIALSAGFESPAAFSRAFSQRFGTSPRNYRNAGTLAQPPPAIPPEWRSGFSRLQPEWQWEPPALVRVIRRQGPLETTVPALWDACRSIARRSGLDADTPFVSFTPDYPGLTPPDQLRFYAGIAEPCGALLSDELLEHTLPGGRYVVFHLEVGGDPHTVLQALWWYLYRVWAPSRSLRLRGQGAYQRFRYLPAGGIQVELHLPVA